MFQKNIFIQKYFTSDASLVTNAEAFQQKGLLG